MTLVESESMQSISTENSAVVKLGVGQAPHGGQEWRHIDNFVNDFSVTTNSRGPPDSALEAARRELDNLEHYPAQDFEPAVTDLAQFLAAGHHADAAEIRTRLILGNGASELIDMVARLAPEGSWKPGNTHVQYMEYERSATNYNRKKVHWSDKNARLTCMVNPTNPTGDYLSISDMKEFIETNCGNNSFVVIDESMQPWLGPEWQSDSLVSQRDWVRQMYDDLGISIFVIHSWTKLWSCPGIRLGSILTPTEEWATEMRRIQVPWSVNGPALAFLTAAINDRDYLESTWKTTPVFRKQLVDEILTMHPTWKVYGKTWSSWLWIDTCCASAAKKAVDACKAAGVPIRNGKYGYDCPTYIRIGVRDAVHHSVLFRALK